MTPDNMNSESNSEWKKITVILFAITICCMFILTLKPFEFSTFHLRQYRRVEFDFIEMLFSTPKALDIFLNLLFFIPFGFLLGILYKTFNVSARTILQRTLAYGAGLSVIMEISQLFLPRTASITDLITNSLSALSGAFLSLKIHSPQCASIRGLIKPDGNPRLALVFFAYVFLIMFGMVSSIRFTGFVNWNPDFHLLVGNEATGDRGWEGVIHELAIYSKALDPDKIKQNFNSNHADPQNKALVAHYRFNEGGGKLIHDFSSYLPALDLIITDTSKVCWNRNAAGLHLSKGSLLKSEQPGTKLVTALKETAELSLEMWIQPANVYQDGPARIVSFSADPLHRNFMLGQAGQALNLRVRNPLTGKNGSRIELLTKENCLTTELQYVAAVYQHGVEQIYLNGQLLPDRVSGYSDYIPYLAEFGSGFIGKMTFYFLLLVPVGWYLHFQKKNILWKLLVTPLGVLSPIIIPQVFLKLLVGQPMDFPFIFASGIVGLFFVLLGVFNAVRGSKTDAD